MAKKIFIIISCIFSVFFFFSCSTTRVEGDTTELIIANTRAAAKLEAATNDLGKLIRDSQLRIDNVREQATGIGDTIERIDYLFICYESEVGRLLNEIERIRAEVEAEKQSANNSNNNTISDDNNKSADNVTKN